MGVMSFIFTSFIETKNRSNGESSSIWNLLHIQRSFLFVKLDGSAFNNNSRHFLMVSLCEAQNPITDDGLDQIFWAFLDKFSVAGHRSCTDIVAEWFTEDILSFTFQGGLQTTLEITFSDKRFLTHLEFVLFGKCLQKGCLQGS